MGGTDHSGLDPLTSITNKDNLPPPHIAIGQSDLHNPSILSHPGDKTKGDIHQIFDKCQLLLLYLLFPLFFSSFSPSPCYATFESHVLTNTRQEFYP